MNVAQFQRLSRLAKIGQLVVGERGEDALNLLLQQSNLNPSVAEVRAADMETRHAHGKLQEGLVFLRVEVVTTERMPLTVWLEVTPHDTIAFDFS